MTLASPVNATIPTDMLHRMGLHRGVSKLLSGSTASCELHLSATCEGDVSGRSVLLSG